MALCQHNYPMLQRPLLVIVKSVDQGIAHWAIHTHHHIQLCHSRSAGLEQSDYLHFGVCEHNNSLHCYFCMALKRIVQMCQNLGCSMGYLVVALCQCVQYQKHLQNKLLVMRCKCWYCCMVMSSHDRCLLNLQGLFHRNPLTCSILVGHVSGVDSLFREFAGPGAVPVCQIVPVEMMKMIMDNFDDEVAQTFFVHWEGKVDKNVLLVDI